MANLGPPCPVTGLPPRRLLQWVSSGFLADLWRFSMGVDAAGQLCGIDRFGLWESPAGLVYFDPPCAGDEAFYHHLYERFGLHERIAGKGTVRDEFVRAAVHVAPGAKILDVGCGEGAFRNYVPQARYTGLDPNFGRTDPTLLAEPIETHAETHANRYDVVCAFQVLEHVPDPVRFAETMARALRPGGLLLIGVPSWPSHMTRIPNYVLNAPPHHLTLWQEAGLEALAARLGFACRSVEPIQVGRDTSLPYWMWRSAPLFRSGRLLRHAWHWHAALLWSYCAGCVLDAVCRVPADAGPVGLLLVAEKPA
jgi:SAM-dependent methyltransferase